MTVKIFDRHSLQQEVGRIGQNGPELMKGEPT